MRYRVRRAATIRAVAMPPSAAMLLRRHRRLPAADQSRSLSSALRCSLRAYMSYARHAGAQSARAVRDRADRLAGAAAARAWCPRRGRLDCGLAARRAAGGAGLRRRCASLLLVVGAASLAVVGPAAAWPLIQLLRWALYLVLWLTLHATSS
ncbi:MAG: hypothetical protein MZW92_34355 [Comamonadaceae bacterium]|nr:hypothetical protein [Comamonadaceae bacterium]